ncbi:probable protein arginine N-methyltransferase 1.2 isoform X1 [Drosophila simulans]|nr:probable protein arginine N-methyltransferase 1.2 isoform X1 [Drosophila simulans]KMZ03694.1 uncharacterized protein Dsimw501_GD20468 [Drosophila simulans]
MDLEKNLLREMADSMLNDVISTRAYEWVFKRYERLFKDKIVLDVGCRSGLLSLMSVEAGAVKVMALGNRESAEFVSKAFIGTEKEDIFEFIEGDIHEIVLPCGLKKVDIIVSEWIGHSVFVDSLFKEVIFAREKWLVKSGFIIPNVAQLFVCGIADHPRKTVEGNILPQSDYPGSFMVREPVSLMEDYVGKEQMITEKFLLKTIDLCTAHINDESFRVPFRLRGLRDSQLGAVVLYSDIGLCRPKGKFRLMFSTGPKRPRTYVRQTILFMDNPVEVAKRELVTGDLGMYYKPDEHREVEFSFSLGSSTVANTWSDG